MVWGKLARPCPTEESFNRGETIVGCATMFSVARWTYMISGLNCKACTAKKTKTDAQLIEAKSWIKGLKERVGAILSMGEDSEDSNIAGEKMSPTKEQLDLRQAGVEFDDEYEAQVAETLLEDFSPISSPVKSDFAEPVVTEETNLSDRDAEDSGFRVVGRDSHHRLLLLPAIVRAKSRKSA